MIKSRTFNFKFIIENKRASKPKIQRKYRNPICIAKEYKQMIDSGEVANQAELAKMLGVSRARVTQIMNLLKLDPSTIKKLENLGDPISMRITERKLRNKKLN